MCIRKSENITDSTCISQLLLADSIEFEFGECALVITSESVVFRNLDGEITDSISAADLPVYAAKLELAANLLWAISGVRKPSEAEVR